MMVGDDLQNHQQRLNNEEEESKDGTIVPTIGVIDVDDDVFMLLAGFFRLSPAGRGAPVRQASTR